MQCMLEKKRWNFANWFLFVDGEETTVVLLATLRNDALIGNDISPRLCPNSVRNRNRQDANPWLDLVPLKSGRF